MEACVIGSIPDLADRKCHKADLRTTRFLRSGEVVPFPLASARKHLARPRGPAISQFPPDKAAIERAERLLVHRFQAHLAGSPGGRILPCGAGRAGTIEDG